jgi:hypothetical protein
MIWEKIINFIDNLDRSKEYHRAIQNNLIRVKNRLNEKMKSSHNEEDQTEKRDVFDYIENSCSDDCKITREYSSEYSVCRVTYEYPSYKIYYWSCCGSRIMSHDPYSEHKDDIVKIQNKNKKFI